MSDETHTPIRETLAGATAAEVLARLPGMGRLMVIGRSRGVTYERIGPVKTVNETGNGLQLAGACHDAIVQPSQIAAAVLDTGMLMRDKVYPRLGF